jgi:thiol-disulfide isomerase/thioredoxin
MPSEIVGRLILALAICLAGALVWALVNGRILSRADRRVAGFASWRPGLPALVYFTTASCAPCRSVQRPVIETIKARLGRWFQVIEVDAGDRPELAEEWGVLSVPTTFVIDASGRPSHVNHGIASAKKLIQQLELEDYEI